MEAPALDDHFEIGKALYKQRNQLVSAFWSDGIILDSVEKRLRAHLFLMSHYIDLNEEVPSKENEVFIYLCRRILAHNEEVKLSGWIKAIKFLKEEGSKQKAAQNALSLFPPYDDYVELLETEYQETLQLRQQILAIWHKQNRKVEVPLVQQAFNTDGNPGLEMTAITYAAYQSHCSIELFKPYYSLVLNGKYSEVPRHMLEPALWGGIVRGDTNAKAALRRSIEEENDQLRARRLVRLAALSGDAEHFKIINAYKTKDPEYAYYFLALLGSKDSMNSIVSGLKKASDIGPAEMAWNWMTNTRLPHVPRMQLVDTSSREEDDFDDDEFDDFEYDAEDQDEIDENTADSSDTVPDAAVAEAWWNENKDLWSVEERYIGAKAETAAVLTQHASHKSGQAAHDILDKMAIESKAPIGNLADNWITLRKQELKGSVSKVDNNEGVQKSPRRPRMEKRYV